MAIKKISPSDLRNVAVAAQCLDTQWIPNLGPADDGSIQAGLRATRREFLGALLTSEQMLVQRAFAVNNLALGAMYKNEGDRRALIQAINDETIIFFFANEKSFDDKMNFRLNDEEQVENLRGLLQHSTASCLRFNWQNDEMNRTAVSENLARRFHNYVCNLSSGSPEVFAKDLGISKSEIDKLYVRLREVSTFAKSKEKRSPEGERSFVSREQIYDEFVIREGDPVIGRLDPNKPFAGAIRSLVDLKYNCNLPDALSRYAVTSEGDIDRTVLQDEPRRAAGEAFSAGDQDALLELLSRGAFDEMNTFNLFHFLEQMALEDILELRKSTEWRQYIELVRELLPAQNGAQFGAHKILDGDFRKSLSISHTELLKIACVTAISRDVLEETLGWWEIVVSLTGTAIKIVSKFGHDRVEIEIPPDVESAIVTAGAGVLIELTFNVRDRWSQRRCLRKYPLFQKRVADPFELFQRTREKIELAQRQGLLTLKPLTSAESRDKDRQNTLNLPEAEA